MEWTLKIIWNIAFAIIFIMAFIYLEMEIWTYKVELGVIFTLMIVFIGYMIFNVKD